MILYIRYLLILTIRFYKSQLISGLYAKFTCDY